MRFLVHGSIAIDLFLGYDGSFLDAIDPNALDTLSVSFFSPRYERHHGGTGANIAWNIRLLGEDPLLVGTVGYDGGEYLALLQERGVDTRHIQKLRGHVTATAIIGTDNSEHQIAFFHPGADSHGTLPDLTDDRDDLAYAIIAPRDASLMLKAAEQCKKLKIPCIFDPGQQSHGFSKDDFRRAITGSAGLIVNEYEWQLASKKLAWKESNVVKACGMLVQTLGEKGIVITTKDGRTAVSACKPEKVTNPTGAGDAARAGLLYGLARKWPMEQTGRLANILGCLVVEQQGALLDSLDRETIQERAKGNYGEELPFET